MFVGVGFESLPSFDRMFNLDRRHAALFHDAVRDDNECAAGKEVQHSVVYATMGCSKFVDGVPQIVGLGTP